MNRENSRESSLLILVASSVHLNATRLATETTRTSPYWLDVTPLSAHVADYTVTAYERDKHAQQQ